MVELTDSKNLNLMADTSVRWPSRQTNTGLPLVTCRRYGYGHWPMIKSSGASSLAQRLCLELPFHPLTKRSSSTTVRQCPNCMTSNQETNSFSRMSCSRAPLFSTRTGLLQVMAYARCRSCRPTTYLSSSRCHTPAEESTLKPTATDCFSTVQGRRHYFGAPPLLR